VDSLINFVLAVFALMVVPGPDMAYCVASGVSYGKRGAFFSAVGVGLGGVILAIATAVLLFAANMVDTSLLWIIQVGGCFYLFYLGIKIIMPRHIEASGNFVVKAKAIDMLLRGVVTNVSNPKALVFFLSFIPQFVPQHTEQPAFYALGLGLLLCTIGTAMNFGFGLAGTAVTPLSRVLFLQRSLMQYMLSGVFLTIAVSFLLRMTRLV